MLVGVLGGMGPSATVDFLDKLTRLTGAAVDQDHVRVIALSDPAIPDRSAAIFGRGPSPVPALSAGLDRLKQAGAGIVVMPCNTAHHWLAELQGATDLPILSIIEATLAELTATVSQGAKVGVLATPGTLAAEIFQRPLEAAGFHPVTLPPRLQGSLVEGGIRLVKAGQIAEGRQALEAAIAALAGAGCTHAILGCTEISVAFGLETACCGMCLHDSNLSLARSLLRRLGRVPKF